MHGDARTLVIPRRRGSKPVCRIAEECKSLITWIFIDIMDMNQDEQHRSSA